MGSFDLPSKDVPPHPPLLLLHSLSPQWHPGARVHERDGNEDDELDVQPAPAEYGEGSI